MIARYTTWVLYLLLITWLILLTFISQSTQKRMSHNVTGMSLAMIVGISIATYLTVVFKVSFFNSTVVGIFFGGFVGIIAGWKSGLEAILEGFPSGIMGGMMGAMLGVMLPAEKLHMAFHLISVLTAATFYLIFLLSGSKIKIRKGLLFLVNPKSYFVVISLFLISSHFYPHHFLETSHHMQHNHTEKGPSLTGKAGTD